MWPYSLELAYQTGSGIKEYINGVNRTIRSEPGDWTLRDVLEKKENKIKDSLE
jgi:hypothetical protein